METILYSLLYYLSTRALTVRNQSITSQWLSASTSKLSSWNDNFLGYVITDKALIPHSIWHSLSATISYIYWDNSWHILDDFATAFLDITSDILNVHPLHFNKDNFFWQHSPNGFFACKWVYDSYRDKAHKVAWGKVL